MVHLLALLSLILVPRPVVPAPFTACAAVTAKAPRCSDSVTYEVGTTVYLRGRVVPPRPGFGWVLRQAPDHGRVVRVGLMGVDRQGRVRWSWRPAARHVDPGAPYVFAFALPGVGRSTTVDVWVVPAHGAPTGRRGAAG
jgi:hypothetical protein